MVTDNQENGERKTKAEKGSWKVRLAAIFLVDGSIFPCEYFIHVDSRAGY